MLVTLVFCCWHFTMFFDIGHVSVRFLHLSKRNILQNDTAIWPIRDLSRLCWYFLLNSFDICNVLNMRILQPFPSASFFNVKDQRFAGDNPINVAHMNAIHCWQIMLFHSTLMHIAFSLLLQHKRSFCIEHNSKTITRIKWLLRYQKGRGLIIWNPGLFSNLKFHYSNYWHISGQETPI